MCPVVERTHIDCLARGVPGRPSEIRCTKTGADFSFPVYVRPDGAKVGGCRYVRRDHTYRCSTDRRYSNYTPQIHTPRLSTLNIAYFDPKVDAGKWICVEFFGIVSSCNKTTVGKSGVGKSGLGKSGVVKSGVGKSGVGKSGVGKSGVGKSGLGKSGVGKSGVGKSGVGKSGVG